MSKLAAQGAAAAVLGAIATPFAANGAFVDPGLNKSADCQALLARESAAGAHREGETTARDARPQEALAAVDRREPRTARRRTDVTDRSCGSHCLVT